VSFKCDHEDYDKALEQQELQLKIEKAKTKPPYIDNDAYPYLVTYERVFGEPHRAKTKVPYHPYRSALQTEWV
jgi:hypothetical protein